MTRANFKKPKNLNYLGENQYLV